MIFHKINSREKKQKNSAVITEKSIILVLKSGIYSSESAIKPNKVSEAEANKISRKMFRFFI